MQLKISNFCLFLIILCCCKEQIPDGYKKYRTFSYLGMKGVNEISEEDNLSNFVLVNNVGKYTINLKTYKSDHIKTFEFKDSLWISINKSFIEEVNDTTIEVNIILDTLLVKQSFEKNQNLNSSYIEINTPNFWILLKIESNNIIQRKSVLDLVNLIFKSEKQNKKSNNEYLMYKKLYFGRYLLIYQPTNEIKSTELQYVNKPVEQIKYGKLIFVFDLNDYDEFDYTASSSEDFIRNYPEMAYY